MATYLITGIAGFIGSTLAKKLLSNNNEIVGLDNLSTGFISNIPKGADIIFGNCYDESLIKKLKNYKFDAIFHLAGQSSGELSFNDPVYDLQTNTQSTLLLLEFAKNNNCNKFIYASSMSVYGDQVELPVNESCITIPKSFYGVGKLASENYLKIYSQVYGINCYPLRLFNVYGIGQNMKNLNQGMISIFLAQAISSNSIKIKGSKDRFRDFIYIDDVVDAFIKTLTIENSSYSVFNIGTGIKTTVDDLIQKIVQKIDRNINVVYEGNTLGDQFGIYSDIENAKKYLSWNPKYNLDSGLKNMIDWAINL